MPEQDLHTLSNAVGKDWVDGKYYDRAEISMGAQWDRIIWPFIQGSDFSTILELAAGHGRNTARLLDHAKRIIAVDINQSNVDHLIARFKEQGDNVTALKNNGSDLRAVAGASVTFVYSFDAMVHFDSDVIRSYVKEFRRIMKPGARGFCHYSNNYHNPTGTYEDHPAWRNFMSRQLFEHWLTKGGFRVIQSQYLKWPGDVIDNEDSECDAISLFELPATAEPMGCFLDRTGDARDNDAAERLLGEIDRLNGESRELKKSLSTLRAENAGLSHHAQELEKINEELWRGINGLTEYKDYLLRK